MMDFENETRGLSQVGTGGAVQKRNEKGEITMEKVKVSRYVAGKRPDYAVNSSDESDDDEFQAKKIEDLVGVGGSSAQALAVSKVPIPKSSTEAADPRLKRLYQHIQHSSSGDSTRRRPHREVFEPEIIKREAEEKYTSDDRRDSKPNRISRFDQPPKENRRRKSRSGSSSGSSEDERNARNKEGNNRTARHRHPDPSDDEDEQSEEDQKVRRMRMLQNARMRKAQEEELLAVEEEEDDKKALGSGGGDRGRVSGARAESSSEEGSEYEDMSSSDDDGPSRLKPVFISKQDRLSTKEKEKEKEETRTREFEARRVKEERRREALRIVEQIRKTEVEERKANNAEGAVEDLEAIQTDDEDVEEAYEAWKVRELKRIKRDRDMREKLERERDEVERIHEMTEEERRLYFRQNPTTVTNKMPKGKYKFLQKYYHRGAFYLEEEEDVYTRDITAPTLEDHFDKTVLPKVMQVKNFGRSGRTKYTHLVDQDTTEFSSPWGVDSTHAMKFQLKVGGGMKEAYQRPSAKASKNS